MRRFAAITILSMVLVTTILLNAIPEQAQAQDMFGYTLETDVVYGKGKTRVLGATVERDLLMDVYSPLNKEENKAYPAVILVHGGAFQRGGLRQPPFRENGAVHSPMEDYARLLAPMGYVCFVIEYRLGGENPVPDMDLEAENLMDYKATINDAFVPRINFARSEIGLPPLVNQDDYKALWETILSTIEDGGKAVRHVHDHAATYGIDPDRIAMGGHSAGATITLNAAYGLDAPLKAIFPLSPAYVGFDFAKVMNSPSQPPMLLTVGQEDMPGIILTVQALQNIAAAVGIPSELSWVPGFPHFYPTGAVSLGGDVTKLSVGERVARFLGRNL